MISKIKNEDRANKGVVGLPDTPELSTVDMQERFDSLGNLAIEFVNKHADELNSTEDGKTGADNIGATVPEHVVASANVQSILTALGALVVAGSAASHTHDNKATLDDITPIVKQGYDRVVNLLSGILSVEQTVTNNSAAIPTSQAVHRLMNEFGYEQLKLALYPIGTVYFSHVGVSPQTFIGGQWEIEQLIDGVLSWRRIA